MTFDVLIIRVFYIYFALILKFFRNKTGLSSRGGLEVEQWSDNRTLSISVDQFPLGACMVIWYQWTCYVMYVLEVCYSNLYHVFIIPPGRVAPVY